MRRPGLFSIASPLVLGSVLFAQFKYPASDHEAFFRYRQAREAVAAYRSLDDAAASLITSLGPQSLPSCALDDAARYLERHASLLEALDRADGAADHVIGAVTDQLLESAGRACGINQAAVQEAADFLRARRYTQSVGGTAYASLAERHGVGGGGLLAVLEQADRMQHGAVTGFLEPPGEEATEVFQQLQEKKR